MTVFAGQGDPERTMPLLWRGRESATPRTSPGPKPGLSIDAIVQVAIEIADRETLAGLSMRAVADRLGRTAMALYTYIPSKAELLDLMYDEVHSELDSEPHSDEIRLGDWRADVEVWTNALWAFHLRHPWTLQVSHARPVLGPHEQGVLESLIRILRGTGLPSRTVRSIVAILFHFTRGAAQTILDSRLASTATGTSDREWWERRSAQLHEVAPDFAERFPLSVWLGVDEPAPGQGSAEPSWENEATATLEAGLTLILDGIDAEKARNRPQP